MLFWLVLLFLVGGWAEANADQPARVEGPQEIRAEEILAAYQFNQARVEAYLQDRPIIVDGSVTQVFKMGDGYQLVMHHGSTRGQGNGYVVYKFPASAMRSLAELDLPEQRTRVYGICRGYASRREQNSGDGVLPASDTRILIEHCELLPAEPTRATP